MLSVAIALSFRETSDAMSTENSIPFCVAREGMTKMTVCTCNARPLATEASVNDLKYDVNELTETGRHHPYTPEKN